jgi:ATP-dependent protease ClpP protease subunit
MKRQKRQKQRSTVIEQIEIPNIDIGQQNMITSDHHTLFWEDVPESEEMVVDNDGNIIDGVVAKIPPFTSYRLYLSDLMDESKHGFHQILERLRKANPDDELEIQVMGYGGSVDEGIILYNTIRNIFKNITTVLHYGFSMNGLSFLFGNDRVVFEDSHAMFHTYSMGVGGKRAEILSQIEHTDKRVNAFNKKLLKPYFSKKEIKKIERGDDVWLTSKEMLKRGIATHIIVDGEIIEAKEYLKKGK